MKRTAFLIFVFGCSSINSPGDSGFGKAPPTDDPIVDSADSLRSPSLRGTLAPGSLAQDDLDATHIYHGFTLTLRAGQSVDVRAGGVAQDGTILDTVLYLYGVANANGTRGAYLRRNDDRNANDEGSELSYVAPRTGDYLLVVTTYRKPNPGHYSIEVECTGGCSATSGAAGPRPPARVDTQPWANPELMAYLQLHFGTRWDPSSTWPRAHISALVDLLGRDGTEDAAIALSDAVFVDQSMLAAGTQITAAAQQRLETAIDSAIGTPATFATLPARTQAIALDGLRWDAALAAQPSSVNAVVAALQQSWPGSQIDRVRVHAMSRNGQLYGYLADVGLSQHDAAGNVTMQWNGVEFFAADGSYLGDSSVPASVPDAD
jgi:hypothetical protein